MYAIHHNPSYYPEPYEFLPERWIPSENFPQSHIDRAHDALNPFSLGSRGCIGRGLAYMELSNVIATLAWRTNLRKPEGQLSKVGEGTPGLTKLMDHLTSQKDGPYIQFRPRDL